MASSSSFLFWDKMKLLAKQTTQFSNTMNAIPFHHATRFLLCLLCVALSLQFVVPIAHCQENQQEKTVIIPGEDEIAKRLAEVEGQIAISAENETAAIAQKLQVPVEKLRERTATLREEASFLNRRIQTLKKIKSLEQDKYVLQQKIQSGEAVLLPQPPPYSLKFYDLQADALSEASRNRQAAEMALMLARKSLETAQNRAKEYAQKTRLLREEFTRIPQAHKWPIDEALRRENLATAVAAYHESAVNKSRLELEIADMKHSVLGELTENIRNSLNPNEQDLEEQLAALERKREEIATEAEEAQNRLQKQELELASSQKPSDISTPDEESTLSAALHSAAELWHQNFQRRAEQAEAMKQLLDQQSQLWEKRYDLLRKSVAPKQLSAWRKEAQVATDRMQKNLSLQQTYQTNILMQMSKLDEALTKNALNPQIASHLKDQRQAAKHLSDATSTYVAMLAATIQLNQRFIDEIFHREKQISPLEAARSHLKKIASVWTFELFAVDDQRITVGKLVVAIFMLVLGIIAAGRITRYLHNKLLSRTTMTKSVAAITEKLIHYFLLLSVILFAMRIVNIPLTAFTFLGGALAIGVGFGAQKLINNFISGFILMAEQPIKVGDLVQLGDELGWIDDIGARSTSVRNFSNINILVPNSYFLENTIINWTHNDNMVRGKVTVGVMYGSPTQEVKRLLLQTAVENDTILKAPEPFVLFTDFGDSALIFNLYFWITISPEIGRQRIESDLRFRIDELFREANIVIAYPQRDLHLDASEPIKLELVNKHPGSDSHQEATGQAGRS